jgi:hypothetical protein
LKEQIKGQGFSAKPRKEAKAIKLCEKRTIWGDDFFGGLLIVSIYFGQLMRFAVPPSFSLENDCHHFWGGIGFFASYHSSLDNL